MKCLLLLLMLYQLDFVFVNSQSDPFETSEDEDPFTKQTKLLISNDYRELMTIYDPIWLANLWPKLKNGVHLKMEKNCWKNLTQFFQDMLEGHAWALAAVDATGSFSSGLLWGNRFWIGSQDECNDLNQRYIDFSFNRTMSALTYMNYISSLNRNVENTGSKQSRRDSLNPILLSEMILLDNTPPFEMGFSAITLNFNITKTTLYSSHIISMGMCLPYVCKTQDIYELLDFSIKTYQNLRVSGTLPRVAKISNIRTLHGFPGFFEETGLLILCSLALVLLSTIVIGTLIDLYLKKSNGLMAPDNEINSPTFKSFMQIDPLSSERSLEMFKNSKKVSNENQAQVHISQMAEQKSLESFHTVDGLIPNKYTEIVSEFQFIENAKNSNNEKNPVSLLTVKKITRNENSPTITLDIMTMKSVDNNNEVADKDYKNLNKKTKYVISRDGQVSSNKFTNRINSSCCISRESILVKIFICFSLKTNLKKIFSYDIGEDTLAPIHGMKFITMLWIILIHTCLVVFQLSDNKVYRGKVESNILYHIISNGTYSVDTFFVLSGALVSYLYCQTIKKCATTNAIDFSGIIGKTLQFFTAISYRYIRLSIPYLFSIGFLHYLSKYFHSNYILELPGKDYENCEKYWWRNALYINTFYPLSESCMSWSWYLASDTQFYIIGVLLLIISVKHLKISAIFFIGFLLVSWITTAMITLKTGYMPSVEDPLSHYDELYNKPWTHIGPYLIGLFTGWILSRTSCCLLISKTTSICLWIISIMLICGVIFGMYGIQFETYSSMAYTSLSHTSWGLAISWILIACVTGYGGLINSLLSCSLLYPLSRLTYSAYLLHPILLKIIFITTGSVQHISPQLIGIFYVGFVFFTFLVSLIFSVIFEAPAVSLLRLVHPMKTPSG